MNADGHRRGRRTGGPAQLRGTRLTPDPARPRRALVPVVVVVLVALTGTVAVGIVTRTVPTPTDPGPVQTGPPARNDAAPPAAAVRPTRLHIPSLGVRSDLVDLILNAAGTLEPPASPAVPGWFTGAAIPGEPGPAVLAGHVDSRTGPGVFFALKDLRVGAEVVVERSDGRTARYRVVEVLVVAKADFPTARVYGPTPVPELRLITCGGDFDRRTGRYLGNVVVSAVLI